MYKALLSAFILTTCMVSVFGQVTVNNTGKLKCRKCDKVATLDDCSSQIFCEDNEECYMDELITEQLTIIYNGGCRAKEVCATSSSGSGGIGKRQLGLVACSRCCNRDDDCNKRLCGIPSLSINSSQCYSCEHNSDQSQVTKPDDCVTFTTCQSDQVCYAQLTNLGGKPQFFYGCKSRAWCRLLMDQQFKNIERCEKGPTVCGNARRAGTDLCHSCCADGGCNYGNCIDMNKRLYELYKKNLFNTTTLTASNKPQTTTKTPITTVAKTPAPTTPAPTTPKPTTPAPTTPKPTTPAPTTAAPTTQAPTTPAPTTAAPTTPAPTTAAPTTPAPTTPAPTTAAPSTPAPTTAAPVTPAPSSAPAPVVTSAAVGTTGMTNSSGTPGVPVIG